MLLITGATGTVGRPLIDELLGAEEKIRAVTRTPATAGLPAEVEVVAADLADPRAAENIFTGVTAVFVNPAAVGHAVDDLMAVAAENGVEKVVLLSSGAITDHRSEPPDPLAEWHLALERSVAASGLGHVFLRSQEFASNVLQQWAPQLRYTGAVHEPYAEATCAPIHERDVAAVAAHALLLDDHLGRTYHLTGPRSCTRRQMAETIERVVGHPVPFREIPEDAARRAMVANGLPAPIAESVLRLRRNSVGRSAPVTSDVQDVLGRPARTFGQWVADHATELSVQALDR